MATAIWKAVGYVSLGLWNMLCLFVMYVSLCGLFNFWYTTRVNSHNSAVIARRPRLVLMAAVSSFLQTPLFVCATYNLRLLLWMEAISDEAFNRGNKVAWLLFSCCMWTYMLWNSLRFWLAFFDIRWSAQQRDTKLRRYLDPSYEYKQKKASGSPHISSVSDTGAAIDNEHAAIGCCNARKCCGFQFVDDTLKQTYGDVKWMSTRVAVLNILLIGVSFLMAFIDYSLLLAFVVFSLFSFAVYLFVLQRLTPEFDDCIAIRDEQHAFRRFLQVGAVGALIWLTTIVIDTQAMGGPTKHPGSSPRPLVVVGYVLCMHFVLIAAFGISFVPTLYAIYCTDLVKRVDRHYTLAWLRPAVAKCRQLMALLCHGFTHALPIGGHFSMSSLSGLSEFSLQSISDSSQLPSKMKIRDVIADSNGLKAFTAHLFKEFSIENILCLIEVMRFRNMWNAESPKTRIVDSVLTDGVGSDKQSLKLKVPSESKPRSPLRIEIRRTKTQTDDDQFDVRFPAEVGSTTSAIANENNSIERQFELLCQKYIRNDTQFSVNLPYRMRAKLLRKRDALEDTENTLPFEAMFEGTPHTAFDRVILELFKLLADSFWRFERTKEFRRLQERHTARFRESQQTPHLFDRVSATDVTPYIE